MLYLQRHDIQLRIFPEGRFLHELVSVELKWSNLTGHLVKVVILLIEVKYDDTEKAAEIRA